MALLDEGSHVVAVSAAAPENSVRDTSRWEAGEYCAEERAVQLAAPPARGRYAFALSLHPRGSETQPVLWGETGDSKLRLFDLSVQSW